MVIILGVVNFKTIAQSMLVDIPVLVSALLSIKPLLVLRKHLVIGQISFSLFFIDHHLGSTFTITDGNGPYYHIGSYCAGPCIAATAGYSTE